MRLLLVMLLAANLLFAMWWLWISPTQTAPVSGVASRNDVPRLVLLSELESTLAGDSVGGEIAGLTMAAPEPIEPIQSSDAGGAVNAGTQSEGETAQTRVPGPDAEAQSGAATGGPLPVDDPVEPAAADDPTRVALADSADPTPAAGAPTGCLSLGPFLNLREATVAASKLRSAGYEPDQRLAQSEVWMGFWVHLPAFDTRADAVAVVDGLRDAGITDIYIEPGGEYRNSVSLGVFSDRERAEAHSGKIRALDVDARIADRYRTDSVYWVDFVVPPDAEFDADEVRQPTQNVRIEARDCD